MSVLCCYAPRFLYQVACREHQTLQGHPAALLGPDEVVWTVSPEAHRTGIAAGMSPRQVRARCPDAVLHRLDLAMLEAAQQSWLGSLGELALPTEIAGWGAAYLDISPVTRDSREARQIAGDLGRRMRLQLGEALQPAIGWDSGKFTARAAALRTRPGQMKLIAPADETRFLNPLPVDTPAIGSGDSAATMLARYSYHRRICRPAGCRGPATFRPRRQSRIDAGAGQRYPPRSRHTIGSGGNSVS